MAGSAIQVGSGNGAIRVKNNGIVVAGASDPCCCTAANPCSNYCADYWTSNPMYLRLTHQILECYDRTEPTCFAIYTFREQALYTITSGCSGTQTDRRVWKTVNSGFGTPKQLCTDSGWPAFETSYSSSSPASATSPSYLGTGWRVMFGSTPFSVAGDCCGGYYHLESAGLNECSTPNGHYRTFIQTIVIEVSSSAFTALPSTVPDMPSEPAECNPLP